MSSGPTVVPVRTALLSVSQKLGLVTFAQGLAARGVDLFSTGGTHRALMQAGLTVREISQYTGFPEMLDGRVKTLHPKVHGGILVRRDSPEHMQTIAEHGIRPFDLVVVNLYPFEQTIAQPGCAWDDAIEQIDIGGPTLIRAAAKNHAFVAIVTDPEQYAAVLQEIEKSGGLSFDTRRRLALEAYRRTAHYDRAIAAYFERTGDAEPFPANLVLEFSRVQSLRYGENPHQQGALYRQRDSGRPTLANSRQIHGKELSYNNLLDLDSALACVAEFADPAAVVIKHNNPCGVACAATLAEAFLRAYEGDPLSAFGCVLSVNRPLDAATAERIAEPGRFLEAILAPRFEPEAVRILTTRPTWKASVRLVEMGDLGGSPPHAGLWELRRVSGGLLVQTPDVEPDPRGDWKVVTNRQPTDAELCDLDFACRVAKHVKSNAIVLVQDRQVLGVGAGQMSRVDSVEIAVRKAGERVGGSVLGGDAFFPFRDGPDRAAAAGVTAIIQPGGSRRDDDVIAACNEHGMAMIFTGRRHFRH
jgi:phosphoribosylaminoimidazolecarboxamide formyltransferase/IMP cyclohydrolase